MQHPHCQLPVQICKLNFSAAQLKPFGSFPRMIDNRGSLPLFGPVNRLTCGKFDSAMTLYLQCLKVCLALAAITWAASSKLLNECDSG